MKVTVVVSSLVLALTLVAGPASAQLPGGAIYIAPDAPIIELFMLTISGTSFVVAILTFGPSGNHGRWFMAFGTTNGVSGTGQLVLPDNFGFDLPSSTSFTFQLDQPGGATGSFAVTGAPPGFLSLSSGTWQRVFP